MNGYNFEFAVSAKISAKVVEEMITKVVESQTSKKVSRVELNMRSVTKGHQRDEYTETVFDGATVYFENEKASGVSGKKVFTQDTFDSHAR
jgi:hypothetical protein